MMAYKTKVDRVAVTVHCLVIRRDSILVYIMCREAFHNVADENTEFHRVQELMAAMASKITKLQEENAALLERRTVDEPDERDRTIGQLRGEISRLRAALGQDKWWVWAWWGLVWFQLLMGWLVAMAQWELGPRIFCN